MAKTHARDFIQWLNVVEDEEITDMPAGAAYCAMLGMLCKTQHHRTVLTRQVSRMQASEAL